MGKTFKSLLLVVAGLVATMAAADEIKLAEDAPNRYVVVRGDTLWDISARFLRDPWLWPDVWGLNKDEIQNPHWIYPGDVVILDLSGKTPRLRKEGFDGDTSGKAGGDPAAGADWELLTTKLRPSIRKTPLGEAAIPSISLSAIGPFLSRPLVVDEKDLKTSPQLIAGPESRVVLSSGDIAFARNVPANSSSNWSIYRPGRTFLDPDTDELLGYEAIYLGDAHVDVVASVSTLSIARAKQEIIPGDRMAKPSLVDNLAFVPHAPSSKIKGKLMPAAESVTEIGPNSVVAFNRGARDGVEVGHVFALYSNRPKVNAPGESDSKLVYQLPPERYGVMFVFRVFNKMSYGLIMSSTRAAHVNDVVQSP
ncbi:MAG: LysM peptidoglycan-binding domain-containing protein [Burkholderiales bacterium]